MGRSLINVPKMRSQTINTTLATINVFRISDMAHSMMGRSVKIHSRYQMSSVRIQNCYNKFMLRIVVAVTEKNNQYRRTRKIPTAYLFTLDGCLHHFSRVIFM